MQRLKIGIDLDGVVCNFTGAFNKLLKDVLDIDLGKDYEPNDWGWSDARLPKNALKETWKVLVTIPNFWVQLEPIMPDMSHLTEFFRNYADNPCEIYFITSRCDTPGMSTRQQSAIWLYKHMDMPTQSINILQVYDSQDKSALLKALKINAFVDDKPSTIHEAKSVANCKSYLLTRKWNLNDRTGLSTVTCLEEFFNKLK